jgi:hypothetical protein
MMQHKRSMNNVNLWPQSLVIGRFHCTRTHQQQLPHHSHQTQIASLDRTIVSLQQELQNLHGRAGKEKTACETSTKQAIMYGKWPVEAMAVTAASTARFFSAQVEEKKDPDTQTRVRARSTVGLRGSCRACPAPIFGRSWTM